MKTLLAVVALAALGGCVVAPPAPVYYGGAPASQAPYDPYQWHVVSSEPVQGTAYPARAYSAAPVYMSPPVYVAPPIYQPYYYEPALTFGLGLLIGNSWWRGGSHGGRGHYGHRR